MRYLSLGEIVDLHQALLDQTGGATGVRDLGGLGRVFHVEHKHGGPLPSVRKEVSSFGLQLFHVGCDDVRQTAIVNGGVTGFNGDGDSKKCAHGVPLIDRV